MTTLKQQNTTTPPPAQRRKPTAVWPLILGAVVFSIIATGLTMFFQMRPEPLPVLFNAPTLELTDQFGQTISTEQLRGNVWVACFVFTNCAGPCPLMTEALVKTSKSIDSRRMKFIAISVDPKRDTPAVLKAYAQRFGADPARTHFLTEPGTDYMKIAAGFRVGVGAADGEHPIFHSEKFFLVDTAGRLRGIHSFRDDPSMAGLINDAGRLLGE